MRVATTRSPRAFLRTPEDLRVHRQRLYRRAAPVFWRHGYRQAALKQVAAACGLSIPALYHYFPSKRDLALYPLSAANRPSAECFRRASADPLVHLRLWLDHAAWERPDFLLALRHRPEVGDAGTLSQEHHETFSFHVGLVAGFLRTAAPGLTEGRSRELSESLLAVSFGAQAIGMDWPPATAWTRFIHLLSSDLVRGGAEPGRIRDAMSPEKPHPPHGPCSIELASNASFFDMRPSRLTAELARA